MKNLSLIRTLTLLFIVVLAFSFCKKEEQLPYKYEVQKLALPDVAYNYSNPSLPAHMADVKDLITANVTDNGATLGRVLFYDTKLSRTNNIACASCHHQQNGFADDAKFSLGFDGLKTLRNSSSIANPIESSAYFWDGREKDLAQMVLQPVKNHIEMGLDKFDVMVKKLEAAGYYGPLFKKAFGDEAITKERIASGLRQFLQSMVCGNAKFDEVDPSDWGDPVLPADFNAQEKAGASLFFGKAFCSNCHNTPFSTGNSSWADIGLDVNYTDKGLGSLQAGQDGKFKIPSLRNVALSAPYMHDGRFATLMDVVNHYSDDIQDSGNLDWPLRGSDSKPIRMNLTKEEKESLVAFLGTFTDKSFINDSKYSNPFK